MKPPVEGLKLVGFVAKNALVKELFGARGLFGYIIAAVFPFASDATANSPLPVIRAVC